MTNEELRRLSTQLLSPRRSNTACPNCGGEKDYVGMCGPCFEHFSATDGAWPVWIEFMNRLKNG